MVDILFQGSEKMHTLVCDTSAMFLGCSEILNLIIQNLRDYTVLFEDWHFASLKQILPK